MKKILIVGASYLQLPLIEKVNQMGYESHVVTWEEGAVGKNIASYFYPISIVEKEKILDLAKRIKPAAVVSIASDLANITVNYVASHLGLISNQESTITYTSNKYMMREILSSNGILCPSFQLVTKNVDINFSDFLNPLIIKPIDRSGSRGVSLVYQESDLQKALNLAFSESFSHKVLIEQYIEGREVSVEGLSQKGKHQILAITDKITTGAPHFVELGHSEPSSLSLDVQQEIESITLRILNIVGMSDGASHTEFKITEKGEIYLIEIGSRMGGDFIGSDLVLYSTGFDFVKAVVEVALGIPVIESKKVEKGVAVTFFIDKNGYEEFLTNISPQNIISNGIFGIENSYLKSSADRCAYIIYFQ